MYFSVAVKYAPMLTAIREKTQGIIAGFIVALLVIVFGFWGVNTYFQGGATVVVAKGDGIEIHQQVYRDALEQYRRRVPPAVWETAFFKQQVLEGLVAENLFLNDVERRGFRISDEQLSEKIKALPYFQRNNRFDTEVYSGTLRAQGINTAQFESQIRNDAIADQVRGGFRESAIVTQSEIEAVMRLMLQRREWAYLQIDTSRFLKQAKIDQDAIKNYYDSQAGRFMSPEQVQIEYLLLSAEELARDYQPTETELREAYDTGIGQDAVPERRRASHILVELDAAASAEERQKAVERIQQLEKQLREGADFAALAKKNSDDPVSAAKGGDLGDIARGVMAKEFEEAAYALKKKGAVSKPVRTKFGYHLIKLTDYKPAVQRSFVKAREDLRKLLKQQHGEERFYDLSEDFYNLTYEQPDSLKPAADQLGLEIRKSEWFSRSGGAGIAAKQPVVAAAFAPEVLEQGRNSDALELDDTTLVALRVAGHREAERKPLSAVSGEIESLLKQQRAREQAAQRRDQFMDALQQGETLPVLARRHGLKYTKPSVVSREGKKQDKVDQRLLAAVFQAQRPQDGKPVYGSVALADSGYAVFALERVIEGDVAGADADTRNRAVKLLTGRRGLDYYANYRTGLRKSAEIKVYPDKL